MQAAERTDAGRREQVHQWLDRMLDAAEAEAAYGWVGIAIELQAGRPTRNVREIAEKTHKLTD